MAATDARPVPEKNVAYRVTFPILDADGDLVTGAASLDSEVSKDAGTFADCTNEATEIATSSGVYYLDLTSTEMNADTVAVIVKTSTSGAKTTVIVMYPEEAGDIRVNATQLAGTTLTARDIGASVLLSSGTGTGQLDFTSGVVKANLAQILGTALTETAGQIAAAFKKFFDKATPTGTINSLPDAVAGATGGVFIAGTNAATTVTTALTTTFTGNLTGSVASVTGNVGGNVVGSVASVTNTVTANLTQILGTALTETSGLIAAAFKKFFNVATPTGTVNSLPDAVAGAAGGVFIAGTNAATTITTSGGSALTLTSSGANGSGLAVTGNGTGSGILATGGATGHGVKAISAGGAGILAQAGGNNYYGLHCIGAGTTESGGIKGIANTSGEGIEGIAAGNGHGLYVVGAGSGEGIHATSGAGANAHGAQFEGVGANSSGLLLTRGGAGGDDLSFTNNDVTVATVTNLTNAPTNGDLTATMKTSVTTAATASLVAANLDHLAQTATAAADMTAEVADNTILARIIANGDTSTFVQATDGLRPIATALGVVDDYIDTEVAAILADTNELQTDLVNGGRLDLLIDAIKAKTDNLPASPAATGAQMDLVNAPNATAVTAIQSGLATGAALATVDAIVDKLDTAMALDGAVYQFTTNALELAPTGGSAPSAATIADAVWDEATSGHTGAGSTGLALTSASAPTAATVADAVWDEAIAGHLTAGTTGNKLNSASAAAGAGSISETITVTSGGSPLDGVNVWVTSDVAGTTVVASGFTNALGKVTFLLDAGTYYAWCNRGGTNFTNPTTITVT